MRTMFEKFKLTQEEWSMLENKFSMLCKFASWQLKRKNAQNNLIDTDIEDIIQDLLIALIHAGVYYKRQVYIDDCLAEADKHINDNFSKSVLEELKFLWKNRTKHGANRQRFGDHQEVILDKIVDKFVPLEKRPRIDQKLRMDNKFITYCKQITWNKQKSLGKKISKERSIRSNSVSLCDYSYLAPDSEI